MAIILSLLMAISCMALTHFHIRPTHAFLMEENIRSLHVAAFNVKNFGRGFITDKTEAVSNLIKILARYDIVLLQETRDATGTALQHLKDNLSSATDESWDYIASGQLGRSTSYLEQYVFFYRVKSATFVTSYQVNDTANDVYAREPFCVEFAYTSFSSAYTKSPVHRENVVLLALHAAPEDARKELEELPNTVKFISALFPHSAGVIVLGDLNADCRYLAGKWRKSLEIFNGEGFKSLIPDSADTATKVSSDCAYDRVVLYGHGEGPDISDARVFDYQAWLGLDEAGALNISDHFPVEFVLH